MSTEVASTTAEVPRGVKRVRVPEACPGGLPSRGGRRTFWVEAPSRYAVNRLAFFPPSQAVNADTTAETQGQGTGGGGHARKSAPLRPALAPHRLSFIVTASRGRPDRTAFLQPVAATSWTRARLAEGVQPPTFFSVPQYAWQDTHLREMLELALACSEAAAAVLLGTDDAAEPGAPVSRRHNHHHKAISSTTGETSKTTERATVAPRAVEVWHVSMGSDRLPEVGTRPIATLSLTRPPAPGATGDRLTLEELRSASRTRFRLGDLLVLVPA